MSNQPILDAPPSYESLAGNSSSSARPVAPISHLSQEQDNTHLKVRNGIPTSHRRSMEDEARPLPKDWVRQYDPKEQHQFFVDATANPPRSIWHHPYDDEQYLNSLSMEERERISSLHKTPTRADIEAESTDDDADNHVYAGKAAQPPTTAGAATGSKGKASLGRRMKDKLTGSSHEEREAARRQRAEEERRMYEVHMKFRAAMARAMETGQPQFVCKDRDGKDVFVEPPVPDNGYGYGGGYGAGGRGYNPYTSGTYSTPNATYIRPVHPYNRPYGYGYGGGMGMPLALGTCCPQAIA
ncbi:hypothetical protein LTR28_005789 [Elasticomyces elasticus]|nr:hypothetical protein LTR28_005789 [Elasticomyces elasticus]